METVSIVVPVYNAGAYIQKTIEMVKAQTYQKWELLLVDDGSKDDSVQKIQPFLMDSRIRLISQENQGAAAARNRGIEEATGEYLAFLDADDVWFEDKLAAQISFHERTGAKFSFTAYEFGDEQANGTGKVVQVPDRLSYKQALSRTIIFTSTVMLDMRYFTKEDVTMPLCRSEDTATWWKILKKESYAYGLNEVHTIYRRPAKSLSSNKVEALKRIWALYRVQEKISVPRSMLLFVGWAFRATLRRI